MADIEEILKEEYEERGIGSLLEMPQPPERLWLRGSLPGSEVKRLAVVGSRALSPYGEAACRYLISGLAGYPISIVSGLALGADACAHRAALEAGLHTIAVPGSGLANKTIAPRTNYALAMYILASGGALLAEHPPEEGARPYYFPSRNRIMVGLTDAVLVIEAAEKSGTLITARMAADYNRDLLCIPHRILDENGQGNHRFLRLGAALVTEPEHILEALGVTSEEKQQPRPLLSPAEEQLYEVLATPLPRSELIRRSGLLPDEALVALLALDLKGLVKETYGAWRRV
ncbi:MAG TPA: DNA-processing protein DprA [Candidatus Paceibacterota bacterium]